MTSHAHYDAQISKINITITHLQSLLYPSGWSATSQIILELNIYWLVIRSRPTWDKYSQNIHMYNINFKKNTKY